MVKKHIPNSLSSDTKRGSGSLLGFYNLNEPLPLFLFERSEYYTIYANNGHTLDVKNAAYNDGKETLRNALDFCAFGAKIKRIPKVSFPQH
jgi:hypothetical protein